MQNNKRLLILLYGHPEYYPPSLNAIDELSKLFHEIKIIYRPFLTNKWKYESNVYKKASGRKIDVKEQERASFVRKLYYHFQFVINVFSAVISKKYHTILVYDHLAMLSLYLVRPLLPKTTLLWYHSHDVTFFESTRKYSIGRLALHAQQRLLRKIHIFSLPTKERLKHFNVSDDTKVFVIPNYPSKKRYGNLKALNKKLDKTTLIYQGTIGTGHGLEEITYAINISEKLSNSTLKLVGSISLDFKSQLEALNKQKKIDYIGYIPYNELPNITTYCHIGIAVLIPKSINFKTASLASNKIYEYAACGLPILYFNHEHYNNYLSQFEWAFATDLSVKSIEKCFTKIISNYDYYSEKAKADFENSLNFEFAFKPVQLFLEVKIND